MKMLDEVIDQLIDCHTNWARWSQTSDIVDRSAVEDAINYLKELRHILDNTVWVESTKEENGYWKLPMLPETGNDPLTWDELCKMEGKPTWVEMDGYAPVWGIIMNQDKRNGRLCLCGYDKVPIRIEINKDGEGNIWQAYRKEHHE